ncbi:MAG TPA: hypothetical protein VFW16_04375 [Streptosporangiaceae bacterium]|nr:hypothetical protein [Streptosporangiaceae bacterium]
MSFSQHLVLWLHIAFVMFTIGPATVAIMSTPRHIRKRDIRLLRYLSRMTLIFGVSSLGVLIAGIVLSSMIGKTSKPWIIVSETLFLVSVLLLGLIHRDQRHAIKALDTATATAVHVAAPADQAAGQAAADAGQPHGTTGQDQQVSPQDATSPQQVTGPEAAGDSASIPEHLASVERGRIVMIGGVVTVIWLVILVLMVWNG